MRGKAVQDAILPTDMTGADRMQPEDRPQKARLADAVAAEDARHLALFRRQADAAQRMAGTVIMVAPLDGQHRSGRVARRPLTLPLRGSLRLPACGRAVRGKSRGGEDRSRPQLRLGRAWPDQVRARRLQLVSRGPTQLKADLSSAQSLNLASVQLPHTQGYVQSATLPLSSGR
jgi:hypothetical protein